MSDIDGDSRTTWYIIPNPPPPELNVWFYGEDTHPVETPQDGKAAAQEFYASNRQAMNTESVSETVEEVKPLGNNFRYFPMQQIGTKPLSFTFECTAKDWNDHVENTGRIFELCNVSMSEDPETGKRTMRVDFRPNNGVACMAGFKHSHVCPLDATNSKAL